MQFSDLVGDVRAAHGDVLITSGVDQEVVVVQLQHLFPFRNDVQVTQGFCPLDVFHVQSTKTVSFDIVSEDTVAGADVDGVHFVAVDERILRHDVPLGWFGVGEGKEFGGFVRHKGMFRSDWNGKWPKFQ